MVGASEWALRYERRTVGDCSADRVDLCCFQTLLQGEWWQMYGDPMLDSLIRHALNRNRNLAIAATKIEAAQYALSQARAEFLPELGIEAKGGVKGIKSEKEYDFALQPTVSWNVSLFGALRHTRREAQATLLSSP